jgi:hypothetical protein
MPMRVSEPLGRSPGRSGKHMGSCAPVLASLGRLICCGAPCRQSLLRSRNRRRQRAEVPLHLFENLIFRPPVRNAGCKLALAIDHGEVFGAATFIASDQAPRSRTLARTRRIRRLDVEVNYSVPNPVSHPSYELQFALLNCRHGVHPIRPSAPAHRTHRRGICGAGRAV